jgi:hypothetical protein
MFEFSQCQLIDVKSRHGGDRRLSAVTAGQTEHGTSKKESQWKMTAESLLRKAQSAAYGRPESIIDND